MSITNPETHAELSPNDARHLTDKIRAGLEGVFELIKAAYSGFAWAALGYSSWDEYVQREFGSLYLRPPREEREEVISSMRDAGMSIRAIASATNLAVGTVHQETAETGVQNRTPVAENNSYGAPTEDTDPTRILGKDGRQYPASKPKPASTVEDSSDDPALRVEREDDDAVDVDAVLDAPAEDIGITPLDASAIQSERDVRTSKLLKAFHGNDVGSLPRTMQLAEQVAGLVSPLSGHIAVDFDEYESLATYVSSAVRQFAFVVKRLAQAKAEFVSEDANSLVIEDLTAALAFLRDSVQEMESK